MAVSSGVVVGGGVDVGDGVGVGGVVVDAIGGIGCLVSATVAIAMAIAIAACSSSSRHSSDGNSNRDSNSTSHGSCCVGKCGGHGSVVDLLLLLWLLLVVAVAVVVVVVVFVVVVVAVVVTQARLRRKPCWNRCLHEGSELGRVLDPAGRGWTTAVKNESKRHKAQGCSGPPFQL